jgi:acetyltransferase
MDGLASLLVRFADLVVEQPRIKEIDINPLLVSAAGAIALDARIVLHDGAIADPALPRPAIRPYPLEYEWPAASRDGEPLTIRPIRPDDEPLVVAFHASLSEESVRSRYLHTFKLDQRTAHARLVRVCFVDYDREIALVVERRLATGEREIVAIGRLSRDRDGRGGAEFALLVGDACQGRGIGGALLGRLLDVARRERIDRVYADVLLDNTRMQRLCTRLGFSFGTLPEAGVVSAEIQLVPHAKD